VNLPEAIAFSFSRLQFRASGLPVDSLSLSRTAPEIQFLSKNLGIFLDAARKRPEIASLRTTFLQESVRLSDLRYKGGTTTYLEALDGQRSLYSAELTLAQARGDEYQSLVQLYRALVGGWQ
jgi:hypothetical protein